MDNEKGLFFVRRHDKEKAERSTWESLWQDVADYYTPSNNDIYAARTRGERKTTRIYDSTGIQSNKLLASAFHSMLTSPTNKWFDVGTDEEEIDQDFEVQLFYDNAVNKMFNVLNESNFQSQIHEVYLSYGSIGTTVLLMEEHPDRLVNYRADTIYDYTLQEGADGAVSGISYERKFTYAQLVDEYGKENLSFDIIAQGELRPHEPDMFCVVITIEKNKDYDPMQPKIVTNKLFRSIHVDRKTGHVVREGGFEEQPFAVPRANKYSGEKYGRSSGMEVLPDVKMLNAMSKVNIRGAQKVVDPPLVVPDHGFALPLDTRPGGTIYKRQGIQDEIRPLNTGARPDIGEDMMESARSRIRQAFFIDQLQLVNQNNMTATEVMQRTEENLRLMGPILGRLNDELLKPIVDRLLGIMLRKNLLGPIPEKLKDKDIKVRYVSQIAKAQRAPELDVLNRVIMAMQPVIQAQPQVMDNIDGDKLFNHISNIAGLPKSVLRSPEEVQKARKERAEAENDAREAELQNQEADTAQKLAQAQQAGV